MNSTFTVSVVIVSVVIFLFYCYSQAPEIHQHVVLHVAPGFRAWPSP